MTDETKNTLSEQEIFINKMAPVVQKLSDDFNKFIHEVKEASENDFDILAGISSGLTMMGSTVFKILKRAESPITPEVFKTRLFETLSEAQRRIEEESL